MSGRRAFIKGVVSLSVASAFWKSYASSDVNKIKGNLDGIEDVLSELFSVDQGYMKKIIPQIIVQLDSHEIALLADFKSKYGKNKSHYSENEEAQSVVKKIMKGVYTGKYINNYDARYDFMGGYSRQLLPKVYKPRIVCNGMTNFWASIK